MVKLELIRCRVEDRTHGLKCLIKRKATWEKLLDHSQVLNQQLLNFSLTKNIMPSSRSGQIRKNYWIKNMVSNRVSVAPKCVANEKFYVQYEIRYLKLGRLSGGQSNLFDRKLDTK
uniref:Uncharacterized protein n=1 Tax=Setaria digitata TaxID=48799 RepID=A0A915PCK2_9BILA